MSGENPNYTDHTWFTPTHHHVGIGFRSQEAGEIVGMFCVHTNGEEECKITAQIHMRWILDTLGISWRGVG